MIRHIKLEHFCDLLEYDKSYAQQNSILLKRQFQHVFLALIYRLHMLSMVRYRKGNQTALFRDPAQIVNACRSALELELLNYLSLVLNDMNPDKCYYHVNAAERTAARKYDNHPSVSKNNIKLKYEINKEGHNTFVAVLPCWIENFVPHLFLTPNDYSSSKGKIQSHVRRFI